MTRRFAHMAALSLLGASVLRSAPDADSAAAAGGADPVVVKPKRVKKNGQTRPEEGTKTGLIWDLADRMKEELGRVPTKEEVWERYKVLVEDAREATTATQYGRWVIFNGYRAEVKKLRDAQRAAKSEQEDAEKAAKKAAAEQAKADKLAEKERKKAEREAAKAEKEAEKQRKAAEKEAAKKAAADAAANQAPAQPSGDDIPAPDAIEEEADDQVDGEDADESEGEEE